MSDRTLPHNLEAEKCVLGAILINNQAFNQAAEVIDAAGLLPRCAPAHLREDGRAQRSQRADRSRHAQGRADAIERARGRRRARLHQRAHRRRAAVGQRRVLREDRQGEVDAAAADPVGQRRARRAPTTPRRTPTTCSTRPSGRSSRSPSTGCAPGFVPRRRARRLRLPAHRAAPAAQGAGHRRAERVRRSRRDDVGLPEVGPRHRRGAAVDGEDELRAEHGAALRHRGRQDASACSASRCRRSSCSCACSRPRRAWTRTGSAAGSSASRTTRGWSTRSRGCTTRRSSSTTRRRLGILEMRAKARRLKLEHGLDMLIVDYLQLMQGRGRFENRQQELASISRSLKILAKELDSPDPRAQPAQPRARDPRRSPAAALRPARVGRARAGRRRRAVHLPRGHVRADGERKPETEGIAEIIIGKQRNGPTGTVRLAFLKQYTRFENLAGGPATTGASGRVIRPTVATRQSRRDRRTTSARSSDARARSAGVPRRGRAEPLGRPASSPSSKPTPTDTARRAVGPRARGGGRVDARVRRHRGRRRAARGRRHRVRSSCSARSASAISTASSTHRLTPTVSTPAAARALERARGAARCALALSSQDRHRHEPARLPPRQPAADDAGGARAARISRSRRSTRTSRPPTSPSRRSSTSSARRFDRAMAALGAMGLRESAAARRQLRGAAARRAHVVRLGAARPAALRHRAAAARRGRSRRCDLPCHSRAVSWP